MTLPASGPLTLFMIQNEFGGSNPISLDEYYKGGGLVPNIPANAGVPTSGTISIGDFYGASSSGGGSPTKSVSISPSFINKLGTGSLVTGSAVATASGGTVSSYAWTRISGDATISITSPTSSSTTFSATISSGQTKSATFKCTVTFSDASTALDTVDVNFESGA